MRSKAVSYTHLDVYKRQLIHNRMNILTWLALDIKSEVRRYNAY